MGAGELNDVDLESLNKRRTKDEQKTNKRRTKDEQKTNKRRRKNEERTNNERRKSVGKLVLSRRILERVRQVSSIFYAFKLTF